jgi:choline dehydrogenase-like flavoprotein
LDDANDALHHSGTTRMGSSPKTSVVDSGLRVHGVKNLYVCGASVFPSSGYANPTLTAMALAFRLAKTIAADGRPC